MSERGFCVRYRRSLVGDALEYEVVACEVVRSTEPADSRKWWTPEGKPAYKTAKQAHRGASLVGAMEARKVTAWDQPPAEDALLQGLAKAGDRRAAHVVEVSRSADWPIPPTGPCILGVYSTMAKAREALKRARAEKQGQPTGIISWSITGYLMDTP